MRFSLLGDEPPGRLSRASWEDRASQEAETHPRIEKVRGDGSGWVLDMQGQGTLVACKACQRTCGACASSAVLLDGTRSMLSAPTLAASGKSWPPLLRMATVFGPRGVSTTTRKGWRVASPTRTCILLGVLSGPCHS